MTNAELLANPRLLALCYAVATGQITRSHPTHRDARYVDSDGVNMRPGVLALVREELASMPLSGGPTITARGLAILRLAGIEGIEGD